MTDAIKDLVDVLNSDETGSPRIWRRETRDGPCETGPFGYGAVLLFTEIRDPLKASMLANRQYGSGIAAIGMNTEVVSQKPGVYKFVTDEQSMQKLKSYGATFMIEADSAIVSARRDRALAA